MSFGLNLLKRANASLFVNKQSFASFYSKHFTRTENIISNVQFFTIIPLICAKK